MLLTLTLLHIANNNKDSFLSCVRKLASYLPANAKHSFLEQSATLSSYLTDTWTLQISLELFFFFFTSLLAKTFQL